MIEPLRRAFGALLLLPVLAPPILAGGVQILGKPHLGSPTSIQTAVDLAEDGDHLLVGPGTYSGFSIEGKGLVVVVPTPGSVTIQGTVSVRDLGWKQLVVLSGLQATGATRAPLSDPGLELTGNQGQVRIQDCVFGGGVGGELTDCMPWGDGGHGASLDDNTRVAFVRCTLLGGAGYGIQNINFYECSGGDGGHGMLATDSAVALYDGTLRGGDGGEGALRGGDGGDGCRVTTFGVFASNTDFTGGWGGRGWDTFGVGGDGGDGLVIEDSAQGQLLACSFSGGPLAQGTQANGQPGSPWSGTGVIKFHAGAARVFTAEGLTVQGAKVPFTVTGTPGDRIFQTSSSVPDWSVPMPKTGIWLVPPLKWFEWPPLAVLTASGQGSFKWPGSGIQLPGTAAASTLFMQGYALDAAGTGILGSPLHLTVLKPDALPDCNGNGVLDVLDILEGTSLDLDGNLNPDECDPDCDRNGILDGLQILSNVGLDANGNGVLDTCETPGPLLVVDAAAASGPGMGTAADPYPNLRMAFARAATGDVILVRDGVYTGASNRELDFAGRDLTVVSENGAGACVLNCRSYGRAFVLDSGEGPDARIEGLTIRAGDADRSSAQTGFGGAIAALDATPTVAACVFQQCRASWGGALSIVAGTVEDCLVEDCAASFLGGGLYTRSISQVTGQLIVRRSTIRRSAAAFRGGGAYLESHAPQQVVSHCRFEENSATDEGGGLYLASGRLDNCLLAGNVSAGSGGGVLARGNIKLTNSLLVGNQATGAGGAMAIRFGAQVDLLNSIVWDSSQGAGTAIDHGGLDLKVARSDVQGGIGAVTGAGSLNWGTSNLDADPLFVDPNGPDRDPLTFLDNDYRLGAGSPCVDSAGNANVPADKADVDDDGDLLEAVPLDLDLAPRFVDDPAVPDTGGGSAPIVDMGPYERAP